MIDWFVLLTPALLVPIILLFVFVGCTLSTEGMGPLFQLTYPGGLAQDVTKIEVTFTVESDDETDSETKTLLNPSSSGNGEKFDNAGGEIHSDMLFNPNTGLGIGQIGPGPLVGWEDAAILTCHCRITGLSFTSDAEGGQHKLWDEAPKGFALSREGDEFSVTWGS